MENKRARIRVALAGNPNAGKTSVFNGLTGSHQHVGNWPGVTVEKKEGSFKHDDYQVEVVDLPGIYSLSGQSEDELIALKYLLQEQPDVVVNVLDATNLERHLYLTVQLLELHYPMVIALNMSDEAEKRKIHVDVKKLERLLGVPVIPTVGTKGTGSTQLMDQIVAALNRPVQHNSITYEGTVQNEIKYLTEQIEAAECSFHLPPAWLAVKLLEQDESIFPILGIEGERKVQLKKLQEASLQRILALEGYEPEVYFIEQRYKRVNAIVATAVKSEEAERVTWTERLDRVLTHRFWGLPIFAALMFLVYQATMSLGDEYLGGLLEDGIGALGEKVGMALEQANANPFLTSFIVDGIFGGVGAVLVFIPLILILYFFISLMEDTGYMARAAYVMDRFMHALGLHGKTAISMIIGSGCNVAGIMSARSLDSKKDRLIAILINPFISCSARLPVYALFAGAFFGGKKLGIFSASGVVIFSLYVLGILIAILTGKLLSKTLLKGESSYFTMELPSYRLPTLKSVLIHMWEKSAAFVKKAGTIIFAIVIVVWALSILPTGVEPGSEASYLGRIGSWIAPIFAPAGFGHWQAGVALITGLGAKEAVVATLATVFSVDESSLGMALPQLFTPLSAYAFMVMTLLYIPCAAVIGTIRRETDSVKWTLLSVSYSLFIGWLIAVLIYQGGRLLGLA